MLLFFFMGSFGSFFRFEAVVQVFSEKQQDDEYRNRYTGIGHVEYIPEEYRFAAGIGNEGEIEHINYFAIKEGGIAAPSGKRVAT